MTSAVFENPANHVIAARATPQTQETGYTGTPNYGGFITGEDYNPKLDGREGIPVYDEMRRSSAKVRASLQVLKTPLLSATWECQVPDDADDEDKRIADFVNDALFRPEAMEIPWHRILDHHLTSYDFGVAVSEKVWALNDEGRVVPVKIAPRLATTFERWIPNPDGSLKELVQRVLLPGTGSMQTFALPAEHLIISTHDREGENWWGRSVLRTAHMHWFYVAQLYRTDAVHHDRFGIGIPKAKLQKGKSYSKGKRDKIRNILKGLRSHERGYIIEDEDVVFTIMLPGQGEGGGGGAASARSDGIMKSIEHHSDMIVVNVLALFLALHQKESLGSNRTRTLADMFSSLLETKAAELCADFKASLVRPLCDMNFNMSGRRYPTLVASNISDVDLTELSDQLKDQVEKGILTADDDLEAHLRRLQKLPPMPTYLKGRREKALVDPPPVPGGGGPGGGSSTRPAGVASDETDEGGDLTASQIQLVQGVKDTITGRLFGRAPTELERNVFALRDVPDRLDVETSALRVGMATLRRDQAKRLVARLVNVDRGDAGHTDIRPGSVQMPSPAKLTKLIRSAQDGIAAYGALQVRDELRRQGADLPLAAGSLTDPETWVLADEAAAVSSGASSGRSSLVSSAQIAAQAETQAWANRVIETAHRMRRTGLQGQDLREATLGALALDIDAGTLRLAKARINEGFAVGRAVQAGAVQDLFAKVVYSALLDTNTCVECDRVDGEEMQFGDARFLETQPPYTKCLGNLGTADACRCVHLFIV